MATKRMANTRRPARTRAAPAPTPARCGWAESDPLYGPYHDDEWGRATLDDRSLFEKLVLEGFQSGLSWLTILRKRDAFRRAFRRFAPAAVARFDAEDVARLLNDAGIVRHRGKIEAAVQNARCVREIQRACGSFATFVWSFAPRRSRRAPRTRAGVPVTTAEARALAQSLRAHGFRFVGPTTAYAFMQAMGLVNDHLEGCPVRVACERARRRALRASTRAGRPVSSPHARDHRRLPSHQAGRHLPARR